MQNIRIHPKQTIEDWFGIDFVFENVIFVYQFWPKIQFLTTLHSLTIKTIAVQVHCLKNVNTRQSKHSKLHKYFPTRISNN